MFKVVLLMLMAGMSEPDAYEKDQVPFVSRSACDEWVAQEARRIERVIETLPEEGKPQQWEIKCVSAAPERGA